MNRFQILVKLQEIVDTKLSPKASNAPESAQELFNIPYQAGANAVKVLLLDLIEDEMKQDTEDVSDIS